MKTLISLTLITLALVTSCQKVKVSPVEVVPPKVLTVNSLGNGKIQVSLDNFTKNYVYLDYGDGSKKGYANNEIHQYEKNGKYKISVFFNKEWCASDGTCFDDWQVVLTENIDINTLLEASFEYKDGNNGLMKFQSFSKNFNNLSWDFGDGILLPNASEYVEHTYAKNGKYLVTLTVINTNSLAKISTSKEVVVIR